MINIYAYLTIIAVLEVCKSCKILSALTAMLKIELKLNVQALGWLVSLSPRFRVTLVEDLDFISGMGTAGNKE